jgi:predicted outer membrane repeat protein
MKQIFFVLGVFLCLYSVRVNSSILYVSPGGGNVPPYDTWAKAAHVIQDAVDAASPGDVILVSNGVYAAGGGKRPACALLNRVFIDKAVSVESLNGPGVTIITGQGPIGNSAVRCAFLSAGAVLSGFTLSNGFTHAYYSDIFCNESGGGAFLAGGGLITNCIITKSDAASKGGGVCAIGGGTLYDCNIKDNNAGGIGGGIYCGSTGTVINCIITGNTATNGSAGGIYCSTRSVVRNCVIGGNNGYEGGGIDFDYHSVVDSCIISGNYAYAGAPGVYCGGLLTNCIIFHNTTDDSGGGVYCAFGDVIDCIIVSNSAAYFGGGIYCESDDRISGCMVGWNHANREGGGVFFNGDGNIDGSTIHKNTANQHGGGVHCQGGGNVTNCIISWNSSMKHGGGIYTSGGIIKDCTILKNSATINGGGVYGETDGNITRCRIEFNSASGRGGGVYYDYYNHIGYSWIIGNHAAVDGGGIFTEYHDTVRNCLVYGNIADSAGGGMFCHANDTVDSCTIVSNSANTIAGGIHCSNTTVRNSIIYFNTASADPNVYGHVSIQYSCTTPHLSGHGNIDEDPLFIDAVSTNYRLSFSSPCINSGTNLPWMTGKTDLDGHDRILAYRVDMGAYESTYGTQGPFIDITTTPHTVSSYTGTITISGTTDYNVVGIMLISNETYDISTEFPAAPGWTAPAIPLLCGENVLTVSGTNLYGVMSVDQVVITRQMATNYVSPAGTHQYPYTNWTMAATNIQAAVDAIPLGGLTLVSNGIYRMGERAAPGQTLSCRIVIDKAMTLQSLNGPDTTLILGKGPPGDNAIRCVYLTNRAVIAGFTLTNGFTRLTGTSGFDRSGGGAFLDNGGMVSNCVLIANYAHDEGGGVYVLNNGEIYSSWLSGNWAADGGAICFDQGGTVNNSNLNNNLANDNGGAVYCSQGGGIHNSLLYGNSADAKGGGVYWDVLGSVENSTITANSADSGGGILGDGWGSVVNSIITYNSASRGSNIHGSVSCTYSCSAPKQSGSGNIIGDPGFMHSGMHDYRLKYGSICFNAGTNLPGLSSEKDVAGGNRIICGTVDMGAYEMVYGVGVPAVAITSIPGVIVYHISDCTMAGTNNTQVLGTIWWSNITSGVTGETTPELTAGPGWSADIPLMHGDNLVGVFGSNYAGQVAFDYVTIHRETYEEAIPRIETNALIFPFAGSMLSASAHTNIIWDPVKIYDEIDGTNLTVNVISVLRSNDLSEAAIAATNIANGNGAYTWLVPPELIGGVTGYVLRFEVIDSSSLTNSRVFSGNGFIVVPESFAGIVVLGMLAGCFTRRKALE